MQAAWIVGEDLPKYMAEVMESLAMRPRWLFAKIEGAQGEYDFNGKFGGKYLAEHAIPLKVSKDKPSFLLFVPTTGGRFKVYRIPSVPIVVPICHRLTQILGEQ